MERKKQMSLILQALQKAKDLTGRKSATPTPYALASFRFGRPTRAQKLRRIALVYLLPALALTLIIGYGVTFWANRLKKPRATIAVQAPVAPPNPAVIPPPPEAPAQAQQPAAPATPQVEVHVETPAETAPHSQTPPPPRSAPRRVSRPALQVPLQPPSPAPAVRNTPAPPRPAEDEVAKTQPAPATPATPAPPPQPAAEITPASRDPFELGLFYQRSGEDRKSTRLNSSHVAISYAVFCLK